MALPRQARQWPSESTRGGRDCLQSGCRQTQEVSTGWTLTSSLVAVCSTSAIAWCVAVPDSAGTAGPTWKKKYLMNRHFS